MVTDIMKNLNSSVQPCLDFDITPTTLRKRFTNDIVQTPLRLNGHAFDGAHGNAAAEAADTAEALRSERNDVVAHRRRQRSKRGHDFQRPQYARYE